MKRYKNILLTAISLMLVCLIAMPIHNLIVVDASTPAYQFLQGDINGDGIVSVIDARKVLRFSSGVDTPTEDEKLAGDIDFDGKITTEDARKVLRMAAELDRPQYLEFGEWFVSVEPTCQTEGIERSYCEKLDIYRERPIPVGDHKFDAGKCIYCDAATESLIYVEVLNQKLQFNSDYNTITKALGDPIEILYDFSANKEFLRYLVYHDNYDNLTILTLSSTRGLLSIYTFDKTATIHLANEKLVFDEIEKYYSHSDIRLKTHKDYNGNAYACYYSISANIEAFNANTSIVTFNKLQFHLINATRKLNGVGILERDAKVDAVALEHSTDMATNNYFNHKNAAGENVMNRLNRNGIKTTNAGENIARGGASSAYSYHDSLYNSSSHRKVMLNSVYTHIGIGTVYNSATSYKCYTTHNFIKL